MLATCIKEQTKTYQSKLWMKNYGKFSPNINDSSFNRNSVTTGPQQLIRAEATQRFFWSKQRVQMSPSPHQYSSHFSADDFATFFPSKVDKIRASTSSAPPPVIKKELVTTPFSSFEPISVDEVARLLSRLPAKHCSLDPVPTWLVKRASDVLAPVLSEICNASLQFGNLPDTQKSAIVRAQLEKADTGCRRIRC